MTSGQACNDKEAIIILLDDKNKKVENDIDAVWNIPKMTLGSVKRIARKRIEELFPDDPKKISIRPGDGTMFAKICRQLGLPTTARMCLEASSGHFYECFGHIMSVAYAEAGNGDTREGKKKMDALLEKAKRRFSLWKLLTNTLFHSREAVEELVLFAEEQQNPESAALLIEQIQVRLIKNIDLFRPLYSRKLEQRLIKLIVIRGNPEHAVAALNHATHIDKEDLSALMDIIVNYTEDLFLKKEYIIQVFGVYKRKLPDDQIQSLIEFITSEGTREDAYDILSIKKRQPLNKWQMKQLLYKEQEQEC